MKLIQELLQINEASAATAGREDERVWRDNPAGKGGKIWVTARGNKKFGPFSSKDAANTFMNSRKDLQGTSITMEAKRDIARIHRAYEDRVREAWGVNPDEDAIAGMADMLVDFSDGPRNEDEAAKIDAMIDDMIKDHQTGREKKRKTRTMESGGWKGKVHPSSSDVVSIEVDMVAEDEDGHAEDEAAFKRSIKRWERNYGIEGTIKTMSGPGGGHPVVDWKGKKKNLLRFLDDVMGQDEEEAKSIYSEFH